MPQPEKVALAPLIEAVLRRAARGKGPRRKGLTAYQILDAVLKRMRPANRTAFLSRYGAGGKGRGTGSGPWHIQDAIRKAFRPRKVETRFLATRGITFIVDGQSVTPSMAVCGLYRWR